MIASSATAIAFIDFAMITKYKFEQQHSLSKAVIFLPGKP